MPWPHHEGLSRTQVMDTYKSFPLKEHDKTGLQKQIIEQNKSLIIPVYANILDSLVPASEKVNIISVGSGGSEDIEKI